MLGIGKYFYKPIDEVRNELIGCTIIDIEEDGRVIYLKNKEERVYVIDNTGEQIVVNAFATDKEKLEHLEDMFSALLTKLDIDDEELYKIQNGEWE